MPVETLGDVIRFVERVRAKVVRKVEALPAEAREWQPEPSRWSALGHLEHLALTERSLVEALDQLIAQAQRDGLQAPHDAARQVDATPVLYASGAVGTRKVAPPHTSPTGRRFAEILAMLSTSRADLLTAAARLESLDTDRLTLRVPVAEVTLNAAQLVHFVGIHEWLHLQHIETVISQLESPGDSAG